MRTQAADPRMAAVTYPLEGRCGCGADILLARPEGRGRLVKLDATPIIIGAAPCPMCKGKGERTVPTYATGGRRVTSKPGDLAGKMTKGTLTSCPECDGTGQRGERLDRRVHVVMSMDGVARRRPVLTGSWDSVYRRHECTP